MLYRRASYTAERGSAIRKIYFDQPLWCRASAASTPGARAKSFRAFVVVVVATHFKKLVARISPPQHVYILTWPLCVSPTHSSTPPPHLLIRYLYFSFWAVSVCVCVMWVETWQLPCGLTRYVIAVNLLELIFVRLKRPRYPFHLRVNELSWGCCALFSTLTKYNHFFLRN